ncbi:hypothetical protein NW765_002576 [Fusarium oxysporum]|nr:hypothetical protein NW765_002576 [Fusarium oxysporum]
MSRPLSGFTLGDTEYPFLQKPYRGQAQHDSHLSLGTLFDSLFDTSILESWIPTYNIPSAHIVAPIPPDLTKREWFTSFFCSSLHIQTNPSRKRNVGKMGITYHPQAWNVFMFCP